MCEGLTSVTLSPSLTFIDGGAFAECSNLSTQIIPSGLTSLSTLNEGSIFVDSGIKSVYVAWPTPVPAGQFFYGFDVSQSTLYVPQGTRLAKTEHSHPLGMVVSTHFRCGKWVKRGLKNGALPFNID
ncbi:MAG: hypothetical protein ACLT02_02415 [Prevotella sp.]